MNPSARGRLHTFLTRQCLVRELPRAHRQLAPRLFSPQRAFFRIIPLDRSSRSKFVCAALVAGVAVFTPLIFCSAAAYAEAPEENGLPKIRLIRLSEVRKHDGNSESPWVTRGTRVYDITEWVPNHPGGEVILQAAGGSIDEYWKIFTIHNKQDIYAILEQYLIGEVDPRDLVDGKIPAESVDNPFQNDPARDERLLVHTAQPCNAEPPPSALASFITSNQLFYVRNHLWVPDIDLDAYRLVVELSDGATKEYSLCDLREKFTADTVTVTLQCAGNRRHMTEGCRPTSGLQWDIGAISTAEFKGAKLRDVLADAGFPVDDWDPDDKHVEFVGSEAYAASIPVHKAVDRRGDVILAYEMNGQPIPRDHGFPVRAIVPGHVAARSVKWLRRVVVGSEESYSQWQRRDYKCFGPNEEADWDRATSIQEMPVQSAVAAIRPFSSYSAEEQQELKRRGVPEDRVIVQGYAYSGGGREITRVDVSVDDGRSWRRAELLAAEAKGHQAWAWKQWLVAVPRDAGEWVMVKAVDEAYNSQPESHAGIWNVRGCLASAWHRIKLSWSD
ncbi:hypothetical protein VTN77DRAFT_6440 [Rasamsonia byssochlamydoides]|uniref:uncharacterized protein n=1 Tax=Rasamsonia byssochlamydoides TaxID=89139 RepID=UPI0037443020